jgi:hypothetical protein
MEQNKNKGRPWVGLCWLIKNKIEIIKHEILEEGISALLIKFEKENMMIIGTYLACMSAKTKQKVKYEGQLLILNEKLTPVEWRIQTFLL